MTLHLPSVKDIVFASVHVTVVELSKNVDSGKVHSQGAIYLSPLPEY